MSSKNGNVKYIILDDVGSRCVALTLHGVF